MASPTAAKEEADAYRQLVSLGVAVARPVYGHPHPSNLIMDLATMLIHPLHHKLHKLLPPKIVAGLALRLGKALLHDGLGGDACVIRTRYPHHVVAAHAFPPNQRVLQTSRGVEQCGAHRGGRGALGVVRAVSLCAVGVFLSLLGYGIDAWLLCGCSVVGLSSGCWFVAKLLPGG